jgi:hypothetical protein
MDELGQMQSGGTILNKTGDIGKTIGSAATADVLVTQAEKSRKE